MSPQSRASRRPGGDGVRHEDERRRLDRRHRPGAHERLAGTTGPHDDAGALCEERVDRLFLVGTQVPVVGVEVDRVRLAGRVPGEVLGRPAELHELLFDLPACPREQLDLFRGAHVAQQRLDPLRADDLGQDRGFGRGEEQDRLALERFGRGVRDRRRVRTLFAPDDESAVPCHGVADVHRDALRDGELREVLERVDHALGVVSGRTRVPQAEPGDAVRVHVFRRAFELGEHREVVPCVLGVGVRHLEEHGAVALHDQRSVHDGSA
jgi:hypothetical protein